MRDSFVAWRLPSRTQVRKTGCPQSGKMGVSPTAIDIRHGWEPGSGSGRRDSRPMWWPTAGRLSTDSTSCSAGSRNDEDPGSRWSPWPANSPGLSGPCEVGSRGV